ncbi:MAG: hypothetical protein C1943_15225 [Halochromatium sp.]|nr:hypothetical protein [Halochromatium sp.]
MPSAQDSRRIGSLAIALGLDRSLGALVPWFPGSLVPWFPGSLVPWFPGSLVPWFPGSLVPWFPGSLAPWLPGSLGTAIRPESPECIAHLD